MNQSYHITSNQSISGAINAIVGLPLNGRYEVIIKKTNRSRTTLQNRSLHLYLRQIAKDFNDAGLDQQMVISKFKDGFSLPVTAEFLKEVFRVIMGGMFDKKSTTELTTTEIQEVYETFNFGMAEKYGISRPWPHKENKEGK